jgi:hypothetical protein
MLSDSLMGNTNLRALPMIGSSLDIWLNTFPWLLGLLLFLAPIGMFAQGIIDIIRRKNDVRRICGENEIVRNHLPSENLGHASRYEVGLIRRALADYAKEAKGAEKQIIMRLDKRLALKRSLISGSPALRGSLQNSVPDPASAAEVPEKSRCAQ